MRRYFMAGGFCIGRQIALHLHTQIAHLLLEVGNLLLLARHSTAQFFDQVFGEGQFDFDFGQA